MVTRTLLSGVIAVLALAACSERADGPAPAAPAPGAAPTRIVALTCGAVDVITALGEIDRIVAVEEDCPAPGTEGKVKIRNEDQPGRVQAINVESVIALRPDAVIAKPDVRQALDGRGLRILWSPQTVTMANLPDFVADIGSLLRVERKARELLDRMRATESRIRGRTASLPRVKVYYETTGAGRTVGGPHIVTEMIRLAGGENVAGGEPLPSVTMNAEAILAADPDVIVLSCFADPPEAVKARPGWDRIKAVREGRIHRIPAERRYVSLGTPRCVDGCEEMFLPWLHPELAPPGKAR